MKHLINLFLLLVPFVALTAQKTLSEGYVKMEITDVTSESAMGKQLEMMKGSITEVFFTDGKYKTISNMMGGMFLAENHIDVETKKMDMLVNLMGMKTWVETNLDEARLNKSAAQDMEDFDVVYDRSQTKEILGYKVFKVTVTSNGKGMSGEGWVSDQIKTDAAILQGMEDLKLEGFPLEFTITISNIKAKLTIVATEIKDDIDAGAFVLKTDGYEKKTMKEFMESVGGMSGMF